MKKVFYLLSTFAVIALFTSCGGLESDAKSAGKKACDCLKAMKDNDKAKFEACDKEMNELSKKMEEKYKTEEELKAFQEAYFEAIKNCDVDLDLGL